EHLILSVMAEVVDSCMFQESSDDADDPYVFTDGRYACFHTADAPDDKIDLDAFLGSNQLFIDDFLIRQGIHLGKDITVAMFLMIFNLFIDMIVEKVADFKRCDMQ